MPEKFTGKPRAGRAAQRLPQFGKGPVAAAIVYEDQFGGADFLGVSSPILRDQLLDDRQKLPLEFGYILDFVVTGNND
jgi:hypothetical protein